MDIEFEIIEWLEESLPLNDLFTLGTAYLLALPIAWDREVGGHSAGLRTFPLVAVASCAFILLGIDVLEGSQSQARILYGLMSGIGFIGGGAILKSDGTVHGTATAASIWLTGAVGACTAYQRYDLAIALSLVTFFTLRVGKRIKNRTQRSAESQADRSS